MDGRAYYGRGRARGSSTRGRAGTASSARSGSTASPSATRSCRDTINTNTNTNILGYQPRRRRQRHRRGGGTAISAPLDGSEPNRPGLVDLISLDRTCTRLYAFYELTGAWHLRHGYFLYFLPYSTTTTTATTTLTSLPFLYLDFVVCCSALLCSTLAFVYLAMYVVAIDLAWISQGSELVNQKRRFLFFSSRIFFSREMSCVS